MASPGSYRVVLEVDGKRMTQTFEVQSDPNFVGVETGNETGVVRQDEQPALQSAK